MRNPILLNLEAPLNRLYIHPHAYFIIANGDTIVPKLAAESIEAYARYFETTIDDSFTRVISDKAFAIVITTFNAIFVLLLGKIIVKKQSEIYSFYEKIRPSDINKSLEKGFNFLTKKGSAIKKGNLSSHLKIFSHRTIVNLFQKQKKSPLGNSNHRKSF